MKSRSIEWTLPLTENPTDEVWNAIWEWSKRLAKKMARGKFQQPFWQDELTSAGCRQVFTVWHRYWELPTDQWVRVIGVVMVFAMFVVFRKETSWRAFLNGPDIDTELCSCGPKYGVANKDLLDRASTTGELLSLESYTGVTQSEEIAAAEKRVYAETILSSARQILTPSEYRVLREVVRTEGLGEKGLAARVGLTYGSFRAHKSNAKRKLRRQFAEP